ncbi:MAG: outer membrane beta-barrel protein [Bacteroidetes bacterium]|nr:outer membrane beta-barrel protein [Bacteroidota bacterium]
MKRIFSILFLFCLVNSAFAQTVETVQRAPKKQSFKRKKRLFSEDGVAFDLVSNSWLTTPSGIIQKPLQSIGYNVSIFKDWPLGHSIFTIAAGIGYSVENIQHNGQFLYTNNFTQSFLYPLQVPFNSNRITLQWFEIPVELRLRTKGKGPFRLYLGAKAGLHVTSYTQFIDHDSKNREYYIKNLNWYRYGVYARLGYGYFNLFAYYSLSELFVHNHGPVLTPVSVGLSVMLR